MARTRPPGRQGGRTGLGAYSRRLGEMVSMLSLGARQDAVTSAVNIEDLHTLATRRLPRMVRDFVDGGAEDERVLRANIAELGGLRLVPRALRDVSAVDLTTKIGGSQLALPVVLAPIGLPAIVRPEAELAAARAAGQAGTLLCVSTAASHTIEQVAAESSGPLWFQLYLWRDRETVAGLVKRAKAAGYQGLVVTVDASVIGRREKDFRNGMTIPPRIALRNVPDVLRRPGWMRDMFRGDTVGYRNLDDITEMTAAAGHGEFIERNLTNLRATWEDIRWLREVWDGALFIKGILSAADARTAVDLGLDGVVVSNHGGRQLDCVPAAIACVPSIRDEVGKSLSVLVDGGIQRGTDVLKALASGADAVMIGRAWVWGLAAGGERGVRRALELIEAEIRTSLTLLGCTASDQLDRSWLAQPGRDLLRSKSIT
ncbi:alpha-hydroxy acid oxidase [Streptomyces adonidis]|uniref:alpha-hydroxy acid oxidase n=1 Tax=Streptomyces adonidis TaxID=3231367 RepID=UPI0034DB0E70